MSGVLYGLFRSVRGIPYTVFNFDTGRGWGGQSHGLWAAHARDAIGLDGAPTGIEVAIVYDTGSIIQLHARWQDRAGARKLRDHVLADDSIATALIERCRAAAGAGAIAVDLDPIHAAAAQPDFASRVAELPIATRDDAMAASVLARVWSEVRRRGDATEPLPALADAERVLIEAIETNPRDDAAASAYADWLETRGRAAEARVVRP